MRWRWKWETPVFRYPYYARGEAKAWAMRLWGLSVGGLHFGVMQLQREEVADAAR